MTGGIKEVSIIVRIVAEHQKLSFEYGPDERNLYMLFSGADATILSSEKAGGFVGTTVGMFAEAGGDISAKEFYADFDWFKFHVFGHEWVNKQK